MEIHVITCLMSISKDFPLEFLYNVITRIGHQKCIVTIHDGTKPIDIYIFTTILHNSKMYEDDGKFHCT